MESLWQLSVFPLSLPEFPSETLYLCTAAASVEAPAPAPASAPSSIIVDDPFQPKAATPEAVPFDSVSSL